MNQYLTLKQAADYCNKSYEAFRYHIKMGRAPKFELIGGRKVFTQESLDNWNPVDLRKKSQGL